MTDSLNRHVGVLDGLRAMAVLLVLATHGLGMVWLDMRQPYFPVGWLDVADFLKNGSLGVDLFFVLSGFLITGQLLDGGIAVEEGRWKGVGRYFKRRFCRIVPAYYLVLTLTTTNMIIFGPYKNSAGPWARSYIVHLLFLQDFFYSNFSIIFWSLAVEFQFYLLAPFFILLLLRLARLKWRCLALCAVILLLACLRSLAVLRWHPVSPDDWFFDIRILFPFSLDSILGGMLCNFLWRDEKARAILQRKYISNGLFFGGLLLFLALAGLRPPLEAEISLFDKTFFLTFIAAAFCLMLLGLLSGSTGQRLFSSRPLRHIALISYSMYLIHLIYIKYVFNIAWNLTYHLHSHCVTFVTGYVLLVTITVLLSGLMYRYVEKPFIEWAKKSPTENALA